MIAEEEFASAPTSPALHKQDVLYGQSFKYFRFNDSAPDSAPIWHYHPEVELVYIERGNGKRHIGNHISYYSDGDLILIGPNLPHYGFADRLTAKSRENVIHFDQDALSKAALHLPEMSKISDLLLQSKHGITFSGKTKNEVGALTNKMAIQSHFDQFLTLLKILQLLSFSEDAQLLNAKNTTIKTSVQDQSRIKVVFKYVMDNFQDTISLDEVSALATMTTPSFCRFLKKQTGKTFTQLLNEVRITHACKLLSETNRSVGEICFDCGYNNFANFNKQFKKITGQNPTKYRSDFKQVITI